LPDVGATRDSVRTARPPGVDLDLLDAGRPVQLALVRELDADLADVVGALVIRGLVPFLDARDVAIVDAPDVADHMGRHFTVGILAKKPRLESRRLETGSVHREARDFVVAQPGAQRKAFEILRFVEELLEAPAIARLDVDDLGERVDRLLQVLHPRRLDLERISRVALRKHDAVAVAYDAAVRNDRNDRDPVRLGERSVVFVLDHLQVEESPHEPEQREHDESARKREPPPEEIEPRAPGFATRESRASPRRDAGAGANRRRGAPSSAQRSRKGAITTRSSMAAGAATTGSRA
jgi:hypothetical protein